METNNRLKLIRLQRSLLAQDVATALNISRSTVSCWENDYENISLKKLISFCNYFNVSPDYVLKLSDMTTARYETIKLDSELLSKNIKAIRIKNKNSQLQCAIKLNTSQSNISFYENNERLITTMILCDFCKKYNVSITNILTKKM